jgi:alkanesulfonate monooxygenase SsuD/methylene tetrahydromethanopterin reductase-like flavin-dependent oxidoreductase (luciferase family)
LNFGIALPQHGDQLGEAQLAESLGFDIVSCGEHIFFHAPTTNSLISLAAVAGATRSCRLVSTVTLAPLYPAPLLAKMAAALSDLSQGRFELGVGVGGEFPKEFEACGIPVRERGARTNESLDIVSRLLAGESVIYSGDYFHLSDVRLDPSPGHRIPIWVGGRRGAAVRRASVFADVWMPYMVTPSQLNLSLESVRVGAVEAGRNSVIEGAVFVWGAVDDDGNRARRLAIDTVSEMYRQDFRGIADKYLVAGTPGEVSRRLREFLAAGADSIIFGVASTDDQTRRHMYRQLAEQVVPTLHQ